MQISYSLADIQTAVHQFWQYAHTYRVLTLNGGLGAGKTTFVSALCAYLGVEEVVSSPTFSLVNEYRYKDGATGERSILHADWYRLRDEEEAIQAGMEDMLQQDALCIVEWAGQAPGILPEHYLQVDFVVEDEHSRSLVLINH